MFDKSKDIGKTKKKKRDILFNITHQTKDVRYILTIYLGIYITQATNSHGPYPINDGTVWLHLDITLGNFKIHRLNAMGYTPAEA